MLFFEGEAMKKVIVQLLEGKYGSVRSSRKKVKLKDLEKDLEQSYPSRADYAAEGLGRFEDAVASLVAEGYLTPLAKRTAYKTTSVDAMYWLTANASALPLWSEAEILRMMDQKLLNFRYFVNHPEAQTAENWLYITRVYDFLRTVDRRDWVTREERSLELFDREKWLAEPKGKQFLSRLGLSLESLKAEHIREPFIFFRMPETAVYSILIVENLSIYTSARRILRSGGAVCGYRPEMLIYGEGWKIVRSLEYLEELEGVHWGAENPAIIYAGDMDKAGFDIYGNLKLSYPGLNLQLGLPFYEQMVNCAKRTYPYDDDKRQQCNPQHLEAVLEEAAGYPDLKAFIGRLVEEDRRLPQEVLNYEVMARLAKT
ncbi:Wadjet anti-phage system protein JetD domain-containing protein [Paenibacillus tengchongensis]|uniref:Wadjet anti-phage system protein JetD domain-containing protein n=1 Tax=Paenibacillus tengchongensis TaxID=2608684 RepID=UPI00124C30ED|nr:Wadjet anti-phage system protein JetD domain-containing protein [Paenibacillus tengchongensis]